MNDIIFSLNIWGHDDITELISESVDIDPIIMEATDGATKKNIFSRLISLLKRLYRIIKAKMSELTSAFVSIFKTKDVDDKTLDQIAEYVLGEIEDLPTSKHLRFRYENDKRITINYIANTVKKFIKEPDVPGHDPKDRPYQYAILLVFHLIKKPYLLDPVIEMLDDISTNKGNISFPVSRMKEALDSIWAGTSLGLSCNISLEEWTALNNKIVVLNKKMETVDDETFDRININDNGNGLTKDWAKIFNELTSLTAFLQKGINSIGDGMRQIYTLDDKFHNRINASNFQDALPKFVKMCVEYNIPSKYIHYAVRQICDISINSDLKNPNIKADDEAYLKGNGRFVIFPSDQSLAGKIIKVAYNGLGVRGNRSEFIVWNKVKDIPEIADELYHIYDIGDEENYVIVTDRANPIDKYDKCTEWNNRMKQLCIDNNVGFIIRCNDGGFGELNGKVICIDYGNVHRIN